MWVTNNLGYDVELSGVHLYRASQQEVTSAQATALLANATYVLLKTNGQLVQTDSQPDADAQYYVRPLDGVITLNGFPSNPNGSPEVSPLEAFDIGKEEGESDLEDNKTVIISENGETIIEPSDTYDGMKKVTATVSIPVPVLESNKSVEISSNGVVEITPTEGKDAMEKVTVDVDISVPIVEPNKDVAINVASYSSAVEVSPTSPNTAMEKVTVALVQNGYCATGETGDVKISSDLSTWTSKTFSAFSVAGIVYGGGLWVAVGSSGRIATSASFSVWTNRESPVSYNLVCVAYANNRFVAVGSGGIITSSDGINWSIKETGNFRDISYTNNRWFVLGDNGNVRTSTDGETWTSITGLSGTPYSVAYGSGVYVVVGNRGEVSVSSNLTSWNTVSLPVSNTRFYVIAYADGMFVAGGIGLYTSTNGTDWTERVSTSAMSNGMYVLTYIANEWIGFGFNSTIWKSSDATAWTSSSGGVMIPSTFSKGVIPI